MWILIRWLRQKPADKDLQCFKKKNNSRYDRTRVNAPSFCFLDGATEFYPEYEEPVISEGMVCQNVMT